MLKGRTTHQHVLGADWLQSSFAVKDLEVLVEPAMWPLVTKVNVILGCTRQSQQVKQDESSLTLSIGEARPEALCTQFWAPQYETDTALLD